MTTRRIYRIDEVDSFLKDSGALYAPFYGKQKRGEMLNVPASFDIETTSFYDGEDKRGIMYIWMFGINGATMIGRTWEEFIRLTDRISTALELDKDRRLVVYVHNLEFEFQFIRGWFEWDRVFAISERTPVYAVTKTGLEFRCSYILSGYSLEMVGQQLRTFPVKKLVGDLDYSRIRHSGTPLSDTETDYCLMDIKVVMAYIQEKMDKDGNITKIQLTKTGYVRKFCRDCCMYTGSHKKNTWKALNYQRMMSYLRIDGPDEYMQMKRGFQGGFTHANAYWSGKTLEDISSDDFTSSYPAVLLMEKYPMSSAELIEVRTMEDFRHNLDCYCCLFDVEFQGLVAKEDAADHPLSVSRCRIRGRWYEDNGRVISAEACVTTITDVDFSVLEQFYDWQHISVGTFRRYRRGYLPRDFILAVLDLYEKKTTLKGVEGREEEYLNSKEMLNSCYGMMVTDICRPENVYDGNQWLPPKSPELGPEIEKYNSAKKRFLSFCWGLFVTAYARRNLFTGIRELGNDFVYADTDSVKYRNRERHVAYFEAYNRDVERKLRKAMAYHHIDFERCRPKTIKGVQKLIGVWDFEGTYKRFKTLGAKRYMVQNADGSYSLTVSGVNKKAAVPYLVEKYGDPFNAFEDGLCVPAGHTGKLTHTYIDEECSGTVTDYLGNTAEYLELSAIHLEPCEYNLGLADAYVNYLLSFR